MLLPIHAALWTRTALAEVSTTPRSVEFRTLVAALCGFGIAFAARAAEFGTVIASTFESRTIGARTIEFRAIVTIFTAPAKLRPVAKLPFASLAILAPTREARTFVATTAHTTLLPRLFVAAVTRLELARAVAIAAGSAIITVAARRTVVAVKARPVATGFEGALFTIAITRGTIAERPIATGTVIAAEPRPVATSLAIELFRTEAALGELLVRPPRFAGTALAAIGTVTPAAGIIVSVVIAGHERARSRGQMAMGAPQAAPNSRKTGLDFC
jgi:hypothetical protein